MAKSFNHDVKTINGGKYDVTITVKSGKGTSGFKEWIVRKRVTGYAQVDAFISQVRGLANMGRKVAVNAAGLDALRGKVNGFYRYSAAQGTRRA